MTDMESRFELIWLMDFYGPMLTEHRREVMRLYCEEDLSLAEIAQQLEITRQGVSDAIQKARRQLMDYEKKLGLAERYRAMSDQAERCLELLGGVKAEGESLLRLNEARETLEKLLQER
jgi:predicted DNA-binding protein YlxM (UPF0122 family)